MALQGSAGARPELLAQLRLANWLAKRSQGDILRVRLEDPRVAGVRATDPLYRFQVREDGSDMVGAERQFLTEVLQRDLRPRDVVPWPNALPPRLIVDVVENDLVVST